MGKWKHPRRTAAEYVLFIILSGEMYLQEDDSQYVLKQGDYILLQPGHTPFGYKPSQCEYYYIHFPADCLNEWDCEELPQIMQIIIDNNRLAYQCDPFSEDLYTKYKLFLPKDRHIYSHSALQQIKMNMDEIALLEKQQLSHYKLVCSSVFIQILILISRDFVAHIFPGYQRSSSSDHEQKVHALINYIHTNYAEQITSKQISEYIESNFDSLNRHFKQKTGFTVFHYLSGSFKPRP